MEIRGFCVQYSKRKNRIKRNKERDLQNEIDHLMALLQSNRSKENITKLYQLRAQLNQIAEYKTEGAMIRSRIRWHEKGEKNTKYFLRASFCKYRESRDSFKIFNFFIFCPNKPISELFSKTQLKYPNAL